MENLTEKEELAINISDGEVSDELGRELRELGFMGQITVATLKAKLPNHTCFQRQAGDDVVWRCEAPNELRINRWPIEADTEADAYAKMLLTKGQRYIQKYA